MIFKKGAGDEANCPLIFWFLKKATRTINFLRVFLLVKYIMNLN